MKIEEITRSKISEYNKKTLVNEIVSQSHLDRAVDLLKANDGENLVSSDITVIPVLLTGTEGAVTINFLSPKEGDSPKKGTNLHRLNIQKMNSTLVNPGTVTSAKSLGFDTNQDGIIGVVNGRRPVFFHDTKLIASEERTRLNISDKTSIDIPLFVSIPFMDEKDKKGVLIVTRFPKERIEVGVNNQLDLPRGNVSPDENVMRRSIKTEIFTSNEAQIYASMTKLWEAGRYNDVLRILSDTDSTTLEKDRATDIFGKGHKEPSDKLFLTICDKIISTQEDYDTASNKSIDKRFIYTNQGYKISQSHFDKLFVESKVIFDKLNSQSRDVNILHSALHFLKYSKWLENIRWQK